MSHNESDLDTQHARHRFPIVAMVAVVLIVLAGLLWWLNQEVSNSAPVPQGQAESVAPQDPATSGPGALTEPPSQPVSPPLTPQPSTPSN